MLSSPLTLDDSLATFAARFGASRELAIRGRRVIPGGYSRQSFNFGPHAIFAAGGEGAYVTTVDGHRLLDLNNNFTVNVLGHSDAGVQAATRAALEDGVSFGNPVMLEVDLADLLVDRIASIDKVQFSCSASESGMTAVRIARAFTGKDRIAKFEGGYHGFTDPLQISWHPHDEPASGPDHEPASIPDSAGVPLSNAENVLVLTQNDYAGTERLLRAHAGELACVILELESASGGLVTLERSFVEMLRSVTEELGILLIFDETVTLRAGFHGMQASYGVAPDLTVMGKIIGGGFPLGAVGGSAEVMNVLDSGAVSVSGTHHGHKVALAAGLATMRALTPSAFDRLNAMAGCVMSELNEWAASQGSRFAVYGAGMSHLAYGVMREPGLAIRTHRDYWRNLDADATQTCSIELANRGFFPVARGDFSLSLAMTDDDIASFIETTRAIVADMKI